MILSVWLLLLPTCECLLDRAVSALVLLVLSVIVVVQCLRSSTCDDHILSNLVVTSSTSQTRQLSQLIGDLHRNASVFQVMYANGLQIKRARTILVMSTRPWM